MTTRGLCSLAATVALASLALTACGSGAGSGRPARHVTVGLAYIPNIQFAPFYVADALGYYRDAGVQVTLRHHSFSEDEFGAIAAGREDMIFAGGDEMLQARGQKIPLVFVEQVFRKYPVALIVPESSPIHAPADLRGRPIGTPGPYGETYFGFLALLQRAGLSKSDVDTQFIQFTQVAALTSRKVDGVVGYLNNEAIQFREASFPVRTLALSDSVPSLPLVSNGLGALDSELRVHPDDVRAVVAATLRGVAYVIAHEADAINLSKRYVPGLDQPRDEANARAVLDATIPLWQESGVKPGYNDPATWRAMATFMSRYGLLSGTPEVDAAFSDRYLPA